MKKGSWLILFCYLLLSHLAMAQDEGTLTKKERVVHGKSVYLFGGPSFQFGKNKGDYSGGLTFEAGYLFRLNRVLSIGPAVSFTKFDYDESISDSYGEGGAEGNNIFTEDGGYEIKIVYMEGGDVKFFTVGMDARFDITAPSESRKFHAYGLVKPFLLISMRSDVSASVETWYRDSINQPQDLWTYGGGPDEFLDHNSDGYERWGAETEFSAGVNLGLGAEYAWDNGLSVFVQGVMGMTLPVTYISTAAFNPSLQTGYNNPDYPFVKKGYSTFNISVGLAYRFLSK